jgi:transcriptional regulator with XRE-family HTH domain
MGAPQSPIGSRRRLGAELRRLRTKAGLTLDEVAEQMTCSTSKISRLETGKGIPKLPDVRELMRIYNVTAEPEREMLLRLVRDGREHGWWEPLTEGVTPERFVMDAPSRYPALETEASAIRSFDIALLNGLLQSRDYARAMMRSLFARHSATELDRLVELRLRRQQALVADPPLRLEVVLDEAVLRRMVGNPALMADQLGLILERAQLPNITVQVLPFDAGFHRAHVGSFVLMEFPAGTGADVVYVEGHAGESYLENRPDVERYRTILEDVISRALSPEPSRRLILRYQQEYQDRAAGVSGGVSRQNPAVGPAS